MSSAPSPSSVIFESFTQTHAFLEKLLAGPPLQIDLNMAFEENSKVMDVLNKAYAGNVVDKHTAGAAIREFEGILDDLYTQPPKWEMVTMHRDEVDKMKEIIKFQDQKLRDMSDSVIHEYSPAYKMYPLPAVTDQLDIQRRYELADRFNSIYSREWKAAYNELLSVMKWRDVECVYALMRVIRNVCDLCLNLSEDQMDKLLVNMEDCMIDPLTNNGGKFKKAFQKSTGVYTEGMKTAEKYAKAYRKERAEASVPAVLELFNDTKLRAIVNPYDLKNELKAYIRKCVELIWLMTTLDPPMRLYWQQQTERVNEDFFNFYDRRGEFVNQTVWPSVFLHNTGNLLYKGKVLAM